MMHDFYMVYFESVNIKIKVDHQKKDINNKRTEKKKVTYFYYCCQLSFFVRVFAMSDSMKVECIVLGSTLYENLNKHRNMRHESKCSAKILCIEQCRCEHKASKDFMEALTKGDMETKKIFDRTKSRSKFSDKFFAYNFAHGCDRFDVNFIICCHRNSLYNF